MGMNKTSWIHVFMGDSHDFTSFTHWTDLRLIFVGFRCHSDHATGWWRGCWYQGVQVRFTCKLPTCSTQVGSWQKMTEQFPKKIGYSRLVGGRMICQQIPFRELTYPTFWKGKLSSKIPSRGDMLVPRRVVEWLVNRWIKSRVFDCSHMHKSLTKS